MIKSDKIYIYPTDTVWGIGGSIYSKNVYENVLKIKHSSPDKPLSILFSDVSMIKKYFRLPVFIERNWLDRIFSLEATLAVPKNWCKMKIPDWVTGNSDFIAFRYLKFDSIKRIVSETGAPVTTTSLNVTGERPIVDEASAKSFHERYAKDAKFIEDGNVIPSGRSSTIVIFHSESEFKFVREGKFKEEINEYLRVLSA